MLKPDMMSIIIQPISFDLTSDLALLLKTHLSKEFSVSVRIASTINKTAPFNSFNKQRNQWNSSKILEWLLDRNKPDGSTKILGLCDFDAYSNGLNFVFGEAYFNGRLSVIYLPRLRQEFYGLREDNYLFYQRIVKEGVHELGHAFGLNHCNNIKCVMYFSNSLHDTDIKENSFCDICKIRPVGNVI